MENQISEKHLAWLESRKISGETATRLEVYSGQRRQVGESDWEVVPHQNGELLVFPFMRYGEICNEKYRGANKHFFQMRGGKKLFYNADCLDDPALQDGSMPLVIVEGEPDVLSTIEAGYPFCVSVPDGAPPPLKPWQKIEVPDLEFDDKYHFLLNDLEALKKIKRIIIAVDDDEPGRRLSEELVRRLGRARCLFVTYPDGCKDFNDVLMKYGSAAIISMITNAKPFPISGVYHYDELPVEPELHPFSTGWRRLDKYIMPFVPSFTTITGLAGAGKSTFANQMVAQMSIEQRFTVAIASFEMMINPFVKDTLLAAYRKYYPNSTEDAAMSWLKRSFVFIAPTPDEENANFDIEWLIERAITAVVRDGIRVFLLDPWNEVEHALRRGESMTEYVGRAIRALKRFGKQYGVSIIVVAHPSKKGAEKEPDELSLYDVSDTAHFSNKSDFGIVLARLGGGGEFDLETLVKITKIKYQGTTGYVGSLQLRYDPVTKTFDG